MDVQLRGEMRAQYSVLAPVSREKKCHAALSLLEIFNVTSFEKSRRSCIALHTTHSP